MNRDVHGATPGTASPTTATNGANGRAPHQEAGSFSLESRREVPMLGFTLEHWKHTCGADHYHLANDDPHRAFCVSFRTIPHDSTGMPHILEHLVLSGSERYPVRDPFFLMLRRSLQTFMNAMTGSDCTYYPFASQVKKDFDNLLGIYLDAAFKPNLNPLDFLQEGHRLEPAELDKDNPERGDWRFKGVVYNEMKGAMGNADAQLYQVRGEVLAPATPYRHNSGGEPEVIPSLTHEDLVAFHRRHYAGPNACFVTYGDLAIDELHARFAPYLQRGAEPVPLPEPQPRFRAPSRRSFPVPLQEGQDERDVAIASVTWMLPGDTRDLQEVLLGELLHQLLLGHAGAPLRHALESSGLGRAMGGSGFGNLGVDPTFSASLKGIAAEDNDRFEPLVLEILRTVRDEGFAEAEVEAALHQLELDRRTISGDQFPFGLELAVGRVTEAWRQGTDPYAWLDDEAAVAALRERVSAPGFWTELLDRWFLDNPHRVLLLTEADATFNQKRDEAEQTRVLATVDLLDEAALDEVLAKARALKERQDEEDDVSLLPELMLSDVPVSMSWTEGETVEEGLDAFVTGTNGILHEVAAMPLGTLSPRELELLPLAIGTIGKLGVGDMSYTAWAAHLNAVCGGLSAWVDLRSDADDTDTTRGFMFLEVNGLARKADDFLDLIARSLQEQRFDEHARILELVQQGVVGYQQQVNWGGHMLAQKAAMRGFGGRAGFAHAFSGLGRLAWLKDLAARSADSLAPIAAVADELAALVAKLRTRPLRLALVGDTAMDPALAATLRTAWSGFDRTAAFGADATNTPLPGARAVEPRGYTTATQVNYCGMAFPAVALTHPDAAALTVAARYLSNTWLHGRIREKGGAYGSRASYSGTLGAFTLNSYRDPRLADTYADFDGGLRYLAALDDNERLLREAILGTIAGIDRPRSPSGEGRRRFVADLVGYGPEVLMHYRARVLATSMADIRRVAAEHLDPEKATRAVVTSEDLMAASGLGWATESIA